jgi:hypothetical protein
MTAPIGQPFCVLFPAVTWYNHIKSQVGTEVCWPVVLDLQPRAAFKDTRGAVWVGLIWRSTEICTSCCRRRVLPIGLVFDSRATSSPVRAGTYNHSSSSAQPPGFATAMSNAPRAATGLCRDQLDVSVRASDRTRISPAAECRLAANSGINLGITY